MSKEEIMLSKLSLNKKWCRGMCMAGVVAPMVMLSATMVLAEGSTTIPAEGPAPLDYTPNDGFGIQSLTPVIRVYKDSNAWSSRDDATLTALGKTQGTDWFIHPVSDCQNGIPAGTDVVLFTSNGYGSSSTATDQNDSICQTSLNDFLNDGGVLIVDMGDNLSSGGYIAPGLNGTPDYVFPDSCTDATLTAAAIGPDNIIGTADDHAIVNASVSWDNDNIDMQQSCWHSHGNLAQGITLPNESTTLMTASYQGIEQPILAEYCYNGTGRVILDTLTKEFSGHTPAGSGASNFLLNLFTYALSPAAICNQPPVAEAGENQSVVQGDTVCFDGSASSDPDGDALTYFWKITAEPADSPAFFFDPTVVNPCFTADLPGNYEVSLVVNDGTVDSEPSVAEVTAISYIDSIQLLCPCEGPIGGVEPWDNHLEYVTCVTYSAADLLRHGLITWSESRNVIGAAGISNCGRRWQW